MEYRKLGQTEIDVSVIALGCWALAGGEMWGETDEAQAIAAIHAALDCGVNFFDTAELYGNGASEERLGKALENRRKEAVIATKFTGSHAADRSIIQACEQSLRRLKTDVIDLYQIHWPSREAPLADQVGAMERLREQGKVRAIGVCNCGPRDMEELSACGRPETNQLAYNLLWRAIEFEIVALCRENKIGILPYSPLMQGLLTGKFKTADNVPPERARTRHFRKERAKARHEEEGCEQQTFDALDRIRALSERIRRPMGETALAWLLQQPQVTSVLAGARNPEQAQRNAEAAALRLDDEVVRELSAITDPLKQLLGANPDLWQSQSRMR